MTVIRRQSCWTVNSAACVSRTRVSLDTGSAVRHQDFTQTSKIPQKYMVLLWLNEIKIKVCLFFTSTARKLPDNNLSFFLQQQDFYFFQKQHIKKDLQSFVSQTLAPK